MKTIFKNSIFEQKPGVHVYTENKTGSVKFIHDSMEMYDIIPRSSRATDTVPIPLTLKENG